jgi:AAA domain
MQPNQIDESFEQETYEALELHSTNGEQEPNPLLAGLRTGSWLDAQVFPPLSYVVPGLIPEGLSLLVGAPKIGKSWLSLAVALAAASGGCVLGPVKVGHLDRYCCWPWRTATDDFRTASAN